MTKPPGQETHQAEAVVTVRVVTAEFRDLVKTKYENNYVETKRLGNLCTTLELEYGDVPASEFGPVKLSEIRDLFIASGNSRRYVNRLTNLVRSIFKHAVSRELVDVDVLKRLETLEPLRMGQTKAPETKPVQPVDLNDVRKTAEHLSPIIKAMVELQAVTGMRPSEVCNLRPMDIEKREDGVWVYRPPIHKTTHHGKQRTIPIVGDIRITLGPYLDRDPDSHCFSPQESVEWFQREKRKNRKSKVQPSQVDRSKANPKTQPGKQYTAGTYYQAVKRAAKRAAVDHWFPYQLRHTAATELRKALGMVAAQALLGHAQIRMTEH